MISSHYSRAFQREDFTDTIEYLANKVVDSFEETGVGYPILCYSGFSGITSATLLAYFIQKRMRVEQLYVRKKGEQEGSHGMLIEYSTTNLQGGVLVFVDDFLDTGTTLEYVISKVNNWMYFKQLPQRFSTDCHYEDDSGYNHPKVPHILTGEFCKDGGAAPTIDLYKEQWYDTLNE